MSKSSINIGSLPNDGTGDTLRTGATKINTNFDEVYSVLGDGSDLFVGFGKTAISIASGSNNIGIGSTSPGSKLVVSGDVYISGVTTTTKVVANIDGNIYSAGISTFAKASFTDNVTFNSTSASGISTAASFYIGSNEIVTSGRQLKNILSIDSVTKDTIEQSIGLDPNNFSSLNVSGISTIGYAAGGAGIVVGLGTTALIVNGPSQFLGIVEISNLQPTSLTISGVTTVGTGTTGSPSFTYPASVLLNKSGILVSGTTTAGTGIITATAFYGDGSNLTGIGTNLWSSNGDVVYVTNKNVAIGVNTTTYQLEIGTTLDKNATTRVNGVLVADKVVGIHTLSIPIGDYGDFTQTVDAFGVPIDTIFDCLYEPGGELKTVDYGAL